MRFVKRESAGSCQQTNRILRRWGAGPLQGTSVGQLHGRGNQWVPGNHVHHEGGRGSRLVPQPATPRNRNSDELKDELFLIVGERRFTKLLFTNECIRTISLYTFFQHALLGSLFASIACGIIGTYIVTRRLVFISGGIACLFRRNRYRLICRYLPWF